jgi:hypothetical protein
MHRVRARVRVVAKHERDLLAEREPIRRRRPSQLSLRALLEGD